MAEDQRQVLCGGCSTYRESKANMSESEHPPPVEAQPICTYARFKSFMPACEGQVRMRKFLAASDACIPFCDLHWRMDRGL